MNEHIEKFMNDNIIIDTLSHGPLIWDKDLITKNNELLDMDMNPWEIIPKLVMMFARKVVNDEDYFQKYKRAWEDSMIDCVSWTMGPLYSKPFSFDGVFHNFSFMTYILDNRSEYFTKILNNKDIDKAIRKKKKELF